MSLSEDSMQALAEATEPIERFFSSKRRKWAAFGVGLATLTLVVAEQFGLNAAWFVKLLELFIHISVSFFSVVLITFSFCLIGLITTK